MKTNKFLIVLSVLTIFIFFTSCVEDNDFSTPDTTVVNPNIDASKVTTFKAVVARYEASNDAIALFTDDEDDIYITGYVVSSDQAGNFFEELTIQNKIDDSSTEENPRLGFNIPINVRSLFNTYEVGRKVFIKLNGLAVGISHGVFTIGKPNGNNIEQIQPTELLKFITRDPEVATITPKTVAIGDLTEQDENTLIQFEDIQFIKNDLGLTFAGEANDSFDGFRTLESCSDDGFIQLQTSTFADFKSLVIPSTRGSITGVFTRDFADDFNVFVLNTTNDVNFDNDDRCDAVELDCGLASSTGTTNLFGDDFETQTDGELITGNGWTNYIEEGTQGWEAFTATEGSVSLGRSARVGSFQSGDDSSVAWLITPAIDLDAQDNETFVFKTSNSFADDSTLKLLFSTDWDGTEDNITSATWGVIPAAYIVQDSDFFVDWFDSGIVDLSCGEGTIYIAFKYAGSGDVGSDGTYELDELSIDF